MLEPQKVILPFQLLKCNCRMKWTNYYLVIDVCEITNIFNFIPQKFKVPTWNVRPDIE
jgi:hypothetical protein